MLVLAAAGGPPAVSGHLPYPHADDARLVADVERAIASVTAYLQLHSQPSLPLQTALYRLRGLIPER